MTLVEMLVVLAIIGISSGVLVLGLGSMGRDTGVQTEANRFADRLRLASDDALVSGQNLSVAWTATSYRFQGSTHLTEALAEPHALPDGIRLTGPQPSGSASIDPDGAAPPIRFVLSKGDRAWRVLFDGLNAAVEPAGAGAA